jgi:hypothetical protein
MSDMMSEPHDFIENHFTHFLHVLDDFECKVEGLRAGGFVGGVVPDMQISVFESLFHRDSRAGIEGEHPVEKVQGVGVGLGEEALEGDFGHVGEIADVFLRAGRADSAKGFFVGCAEIMQNLVELVDVVPAFEEGTPAEEFGQDAAYGPDVD